MKLINNSLQTSIDTLWKQELSAFQDRGYILSNPERFQNESHFVEISGDDINLNQV